jgi:hypothetical protein
VADRNSLLGYDMKCGTDIEPSGRSASGAELVADAILHMITTGDLPMVESENGYIEFGDDVRKWIGLELTQDGLEARAAGLGVIIERDKRVRQVEISATMTTRDPTLWAIEIAITATLRTGETISTVFGVSALTVERLAQGT